MWPNPQFHSLKKSIMENFIFLCSVSNHSGFDLLWFFNGSHCLKSVRIWNYSGPHFPAFGLNTERYAVSLHYFLKLLFLSLKYFILEYLHKNYARKIWVKLATKKGKIRGEEQKNRSGVLFACVNVPHHDS